MKYWLVHWEWMGEHAAKPYRTVMVLEGGTSLETVRRYVEKTYMEHEYTKAEICSYAIKPSDNPYPASIHNAVSGESRIACGHNPHLEARLVDDPMAEIKELGEEDISLSELTAG